MHRGRGLTMEASYAMGVIGAGLPAHLMMQDVAVTEERLPFTVRVARNESQLHKAVSIRQRAYGRHVPALAERVPVRFVVRRAGNTSTLRRERPA